jgi:hypothetical protein
MVMLLLFFFGIVTIMFLLVVFGTLAKNRWGININPTVCCHCNAALSTVRRPKSLRQVLWGGGTCGACGTEMDKWGRPLRALRGTPEK